ncbi:MAG: hypothetical protein Q8R55_06670 [Candidatus Taylorbacteria bacterium]|nr:hypothetical protein [Candidatus Taylorbacteria bacterium]
MLKNIFKPTKKKILSSILLAIIMSAIGFAVPTVYKEGSLPLIILGVLGAGYLLFQLIFFIIFTNIILGFGSFSSISIALVITFLPFIGQFLYAYLIFCVYHFFKDRKNAKIDSLNPPSPPPLTNDETSPTILPGGMRMQSHTFSLTKEIREMKVLRSPWFLVPVVVLSVILGSTWLYAQKSGKPTIQWSQKKVIEFILPNTTQNIPISFKSGVNLNNVTFFVTPGLRNVVSVNPSQFPSISAGNDYNLTLTINSGNQSQVQFEGTVHLRDNLNYATNALPLPVTVVVHNEPVPPDPGEAGKQTLEGIDSDNDGVRDDIQRWIVLNYLDSEKRRAALREDVKILQSFILDADDKQLSILHSKNMARAGLCEDYVFSVLNDAVRSRRDLEVEFLNTEVRSRAYIKANSQLGGTFGIPTYYGQDLKPFCTFDPDLMEN